MANIPDKPSLDGIETRWMQQWEADGTYRFDRTAGRAEVFAVDTPPPTVSGSLHIGHVFSYTHTDTVARFQRMRGKRVFYPIGWDDNGLATERRVQNVTGVRCDPSLPHDPTFTAPFRGDVPKDHRAVPVSRPNFVELCREVTHLDEQVFEELFRRLGLRSDLQRLQDLVGLLLLVFLVLQPFSASIGTIALSLIAILPAPAGGQAYPAKPIRMVVTFPPGGATDLLGRVVGGDAVHGVPPLVVGTARRARSRAMARRRRDFTVPRGMPSARSISTCGRFS